MAFVAIMAASKVWDDISCSSKSFALCSSDFSLRELNEMERLFCELLQFKLFLDSSDYKDYYYDMKKVWLSIETDDECVVRNWTDATVVNQPVDSNWAWWGIGCLKNQIMSGDVKQVKLV